MVIDDNDAVTPSQTLGPLYGFALMFPGSESMLDAGEPTAVRIEGRVIDGQRQPVAFPDCMLELWEADQFVRTRTDPEGRFTAIVRRPSPAASPAGMRQAPHLNVAIMARGLLKQLMTRIYFPEEELANASDPVLLAVPPARRETLVARKEASAYGFDIHLQGPGETVFFAF